MVITELPQALRQIHPMHRAHVAKPTCSALSPAKLGSSSDDGVDVLARLGLSVGQLLLEERDLSGNALR